jgi:hypothetical protein
MEGTYGLETMLGDDLALWVRDDTPQDEKEYHARFYFDPNTAENENDEIGLFSLTDESPLNTLALLYVEYWLGEYRMRGLVRGDDGIWIYGPWVSINRGRQALEIDWRAASVPGANDGRYTILVNGDKVIELTGLDNDTHGVDLVQLGAGVGKILEPTSTGSFYFDAFVSSPSSDIGLDTGIPIEIPDTSGDLIAADGFESGDFSEWGSYFPKNGDISVSAQAALGGTYGMQVDFNGEANMFVGDFSPYYEDRYRARFYLDTNGISAEGDYFDLFAAYDRQYGIPPYARVLFKQLNGNYYINAGILRDDKVMVLTPGLLLTDGMHAIEIDWRAASVPGANDGGLTLWVDGVEKRNLIGIDNDTHRISRVYLGAGVHAGSTVDPTSTGTMYFDAFVSNRDSYIGLAPWHIASP